jgi:hypothetical protein
MQVFNIAKGLTSVILPVSIYDSSSTTGAKLAGLTYSTCGTVYYNRTGAAGAATVITTVTATKGTWTSSGFVQIDNTNMPGDYELHLPDAVCLTGAETVMIQIKGGTNAVPCNVLINLFNTPAAGIKKNTLLNNFSFLMRQSADHLTPATGLTVTATRSIDGAAFAACANSVSEISNGFYKINLAATDVNGDVIDLLFTATGADATAVTVKTSQT